MSTQTLSAPAEQYRAIVERSTDIDAPPQAIFDAVIEDMQSIPDQNGKSMNLKLEQFPGGRWFRDLGNNVGHLWGHVQVIKPPTLIEIYGPLMISSAAINHVSYRITAEGGTHRLTIKHRIFGDFDPSIPQGVGMGWQMVVDRIKARLQK